MEKRWKKGAAYFMTKILKYFGFPELVKESEKVMSSRKTW